MMKKFLTPVFTFFLVQVFSQNLPPVLSNVQTSVSGTVLTLIYDLEDEEGDLVTVSFLAGESGSPVFNFDTGNATGDIGPGIVPGPGKTIQWDLSAYVASLPYYRLMLVADDLQPVDIQAIVDQVDSSRIFGDMLFLEGIRHRTTGAAHLQQSKDFIFNQFLAKNLEAYFQSFTFGGYQATNIIAQHVGTSGASEVYILGGHFDSVSNSPGADDNASAIAGTLEAMRILTNYPFKKSIKFIGFDLEEDGLVGSTRYVQQGILPGENIAGFLCFEMIGYYTEAVNTQLFPPGFNLLFPALYNEVASEGFRGNFITNVGKVGNSVPLMDAFSNAAAAYVPDLKVKSLAAPANWQTITPDLGRSDHAPFWVADIPAVMLTDGANFRNPHYHTPNDLTSTLNMTFLSRNVQAAIATLAELAEVQHAGTWLADVELPTATTEPNPCDISLSPNPAEGYLRLEWSDCQNAAPTEILVTDLHGRIHLSRKIEAHANGIFNLDVRHLARGIYFLKMNGKGVKRVVLN
mgnify:CR=1 FL=1